jgi:hypothetical protein
MANNRFRGKKQSLFALKRLKPEIRLEIEKATEANAKEFAALARKWAPAREGGNQDLKKSTKAVPMRDGAAIRWRVVSGDEVAFYARMVEFGTAPGKRGDRTTNASGRRRKVLRTHPGTAAQPYFFPAYRALRSRLKRRLSRGLSRGKKRALS